MKIATLAIAAAAALTAGAATLDGIAAKVGESTITIGEVMQEVGRLPQARELVEAEGNNPETMKKIYRMAVDELVEKRLILKAAEDKKLELQDWVVENRIREIIKEAFGGDRNRLLEALGRNRTTYADWQKTIREDLILAAMRWQMVEKNCAPTPAEIRQEWARNKTSYTSEAKMDVSVILLRPEDNMPVEDRGKAILEKLADGADFASLAREFSADSHAMDGGAWRDVKPEEAFREEIVDALAKLSPGEHSGLIDLDGWGFIVRKDAETAGGQKSFSAAYDELAAAVRRAKSEKEFRAWIDRLKADTYIHIYPMPEL